MLGMVWVGSKSCSVGQADGVGELDPLLLALVGVPVVVGSDAHFDVAQLTGLVLDRLGDVVTGGLGGRLLVAGQAGGQNQGAVELVVLFPDLTHLYVLVADTVRPVAGSPFRDVHGFQGIFPSVPVYLTGRQGDPRHRLQFFRYRNRDGRIALVFARPYDLVANL